MSILKKDESLKNNSPTNDKHLPIGDNNPPNEKLLLNGENANAILFFPEEKTENITINSSLFILSDIERKYLTFSDLSITTQIDLVIVKLLPCQFIPGL